MIQNHDLETLMHWARTHFFGKYRGKVVDTNDPLGKGRLKVQVPSVFGQDTSVWAMPCVPYAGDQVGFKSFPPVDTNVWVEFEGGDISYPVWTGFFWGDGEMPSEAGTDDNVKLWKTGTVTIQIDDQAGEIVISTTGGATLTMASDIKGEVGSSTLTIDTSGVTSEAGAKLEVTQVSIKLNNGAMEVM